MIPWPFGSDKKFTEIEKRFIGITTRDGFPTSKYDAEMLGVGMECENCIEDEGKPKCKYCGAEIKNNEQCFCCGAPK